MSLYEIVSMVQALDKRRKKFVSVSDEEFAEAAALLASATANDPSVRV